MYERGKELSKSKTKKQSEEKKKEKKGIKDRITRDIRTLFEQENDDYYKLKRVSNFRNKSYIEHGTEIKTYLYNPGQNISDKL